MGSMDINFYFLGGRNYVNGLSIFEEMLKTYRLSCGVDFPHISKIKTFKINKFVRNNSWIELYKPVEIRKKAILPIN